MLGVLACALQSAEAKNNRGAAALPSMRKSQSGFTLIEVMIVVAIIGIIASVAMPSMRNYAARAKVSEAILILTNCRNQIQEVYVSGSDLPGADNWGCEATNPSKYVASVSTTDNGIVTVRLGNQVGDLRLAQFYVTMAPLNGAGQVMDEDDVGTPVRRWRCGSTLDGTDLKRDFLPQSCSGG
jgi:type IV pilus assembly protein PilA